MKRLCKTAFMALVAIFFASPNIDAQVVSLTSVPSTGTNAGIGVESGSSTTSSTLDLSLLNWRTGLLSPYLPSNITTSATTASTISATPITNTPSNANPYTTSVVSTISQPSNVMSNPVPSPVVVPATQAVAPRTTTVFAPRFVSFTSITNETTSTSTIVANLNSNNSSTIYNLNAIAGGSNPLMMSVPEPTTLALCVGLLALTGYGYTKRQQKQAKPVDSETDAILQGETHESISV